MLYIVTVGHLTEMVEASSKREASKLTRLNGDIREVNVGSADYERFYSRKSRINQAKVVHSRIALD